MSENCLLCIRLRWWPTFFHLKRNWKGSHNIVRHLFDVKCSPLILFDSMYCVFVLSSRTDASNARDANFLFCQEQTYYFSRKSDLAITLVANWQKISKSNRKASPAILQRQSGQSNCFKFRTKITFPWQHHFVPKFTQQWIQRTHKEKVKHKRELQWWTKNWMQMMKCGLLYCSEQT